MTFQTCDLSPFVAKVVAQKGSLEDAASALQIFIRQLEGYLRQLKLAVCTDLGNAGGARNFIELLDVPHSYLGQASKLVRVNAAQTGLEFFTAAAGVTKFTQLTDVPNSYVAQALKLVRVNAAATALEFFTQSLVTAFIQLSDVPNSYSGAALKHLRVNAAATAVEFITDVLTLNADFPANYTAAALKALRVNAGATAVEFFTQAFTLLSDVPASYSGQANKILIVNAAETAVAFSDVTIVNSQLAPGDAILLTQIATPSTPAANKGTLFYTNTAGAYNALMWMDEHGQARGFRGMPIGRAFIWMHCSGAGSAAVLGDCTLTLTPTNSTGSTVSTPVVANTNAITASIRLKCIVSNGAANRTAGVLFANATQRPFFLGGSANQGGFWFHCRYATSVTSATQRTFIGLDDNSNSISGTLVVNFINCMGVGFESGDANWSFFNNDGTGACTKTTLGSNCPVDSTSIYDLYMYAAPNGSSVDYFVMNRSTGNHSSGTISSNLPAALAGLLPFAVTCSGATPAAPAMDLWSVYCEAMPPTPIGP